MDSMDDPESNAKISDSAYSNSCSNSQSRRSHSSKSTHSGSNSSGSSGYGGKASKSGSSNILGQPPKKEKVTKKKKISQTQVKSGNAAPAEPAGLPAPDPILTAPKEESNNVDESSMAIALPEKVADEMDSGTTETNVAKQETSNALQPVSTGEHYVTSYPSSSSSSSDGFSCVISMRDGIVMYTSASLSATLGFPKDYWIGRSFIEFVHPRDHKTFASLITNRLALPKLEHGRHDRGQNLNSNSTMVCRVRRYRSLNACFGVKGLVVTFMPFLLNCFFKDCSEDELKVIYLVIQASPFFSAFKTPNELVAKPVPFVIRHASDGFLEYIDPESVPYLGYLPQDIQDKNALLLYHPEDLPYLRQVYETLVKEGTVSSSRPYKIQTQNGGYIRVETEWSSVVNPWSMKLEFVIAKHHIIEGPNNPDVFQSPELDRSSRISETDRYRLEAFRESVIRVMNEIRTKPTGAAKQHMGKRCQDLMSFMETLIKETPKQDDDHKSDVQELTDRKLSYYERDSVMLGGISPHHDSDSKSSIETPLSYTQINYNENLQRYFDSQQPDYYKNYSAGDSPKELGSKDHKPPSSKCYSPVAQHSGEFNEMSSNSSAVGMYVSSPGPALSDYTQQVKLTESTIKKISRSALNRHNAEMEKELVKMHRESRSSKGDREKISNESRQMKKEHLARCNASFHPTSAGDASTDRNRQKESSRATKRASKPQYNEGPAQKHHCPSSRQPTRRHFPTTVPQSSEPPVTPSANVGATQWPTSHNVPSFNMFGMGMPQHVHMGPVPAQGQCHTMPNNNNPAAQPMPGSSTRPMPGPSNTEPRPGTSAMPGIPTPYGLQAMPVIPGMPGMYPVYYAPSAACHVNPTSKEEAFPSTSNCQPFQPSLPYMVQGHPISMVYGQPYVYSPINHQMYPVDHSITPQQTLNLDTSNYEQAYSSNQPLPPRNCHNPWTEKRSPSPRTFHYEYPMSGLERSSEFMPSSSTSQCEKSKNTRISDDNADRTDGESSYSSFYSSFFKTDSGSADDSGDQKINTNKANEVKNRFWTKNVQGDDAMSFQSSNDDISPFSKAKNNKKLARRKMAAPWNEEVNLTPELIYKYQLAPKPMDEVLNSDKQRMRKMDQPSLVSEQLDQLYVDLQLQGVAARLTLEEGITSSSSSGEETTPNNLVNLNKVKRKREFSKLAIIHEENAPFPTPGSGYLVPDGLPDVGVTNGSSMMDISS